MRLLDLVLLIAAAVFFALATFRVAEPRRFSWLAAGLLCWLLIALIAAARAYSTV